MIIIHVLMCCHDVEYGVVNVAIRLCLVLQTCLELSTDLAAFWTCSVCHKLIIRLELSSIFIYSICRKITLGGTWGLNISLFQQGFGFIISLPILVVAVMHQETALCPMGHGHRIYTG